MGDVAGVAVKIQQHALGLAGYEPAVDTNPVARFECHVLVIESDRAWRGIEIPARHVGQVQHPRLCQVDNGSQQQVCAGNDK